MRNSITVLVLYLNYFRVRNSSSFLVFYKIMDISELKGEAKTWNLASDSKLLEYLQHFSSGVTDRTKSFAEKVDELTFDVADSEVSLKNTFNDFLMLGNSQFIENVSTTVAFFALFAN